jgi:hypothetical protein
LANAYLSSVPMDLSPATAVTSLEHWTWLRHAECGQNWRATAVTSDERNQDSGEQPRQRDRAVWALLSEHSPGQPWWLGYLDTGVDDMVFPGAPMVTLYAGWHYVLVEAGPEQAATWRRNDPVSYGALPNLMFPADRWLVSTLWDDDWSCIGGHAGLVGRFLRHPDLQTRPVRPGQDAASCALVVLSAQRQTARPFWVPGRNQPGAPAV